MRQATPQPRPVASSTCVCSCSHKQSPTQVTACAVLMDPFEHNTRTEQRTRLDDPTELSSRASHTHHRPIRQTSETRRQLQHLLGREDAVLGQWSLGAPLATSAPPHPPLRTLALHLPTSPSAARRCSYAACAAWKRPTPSPPAASGWCLRAARRYAAFSPAALSGNDASPRACRWRCASASSAALGPPPHPAREVPGPGPWWPGGGCARNA